MASVTPDDDRAHCASRAYARSRDFTRIARTRKADVRREQSNAEMPVYWLSEVSLTLPRPAARLHRLHRRPHPNDRRCRRAAQAPRSRSRRRAEAQGEVAAQGVLRRDALPFDHKGVHFIALGNVSDPTGKLGDDQIQWLRADLARHDKEAPIVVLTHRPLFDLAPDWDWATSDGAAAIEALMPYEYVTVFYGHIHQEHHQMTGHIPHHAAKGLMFALPAPHSVPKKMPIPWDAANPYRGLGFRTVQAKGGGDEYALSELAVETV